MKSGFVGLRWRATNTWMALSKASKLLNQEHKSQGYQPLCSLGVTPSRPVSQAAFKRRDREALTDLKLRTLRSRKKYLQILDKI
jgi:hypothetical protein